MEGDILRPHSGYYETGIWNVTVCLVIHCSTYRLTSVDSLMDLELYLSNIKSTFLKYKNKFEYKKYNNVKISFPKFYSKENTNIQIKHDPFYKINIEVATMN